LSIRTDSRKKSKETRLKELYTISGPAWLECRRLMASTNRLVFGNNKMIPEQREMLARYVEARIKEQEILIRSVSNNVEDSDQKDSIRIAISDKLDSLSRLLRKKF